MCTKLFWLSDEQWTRIERFLPTDVRGVERIDVSSAGSFISRAVGAGAIARTIMVRRLRSITASCARHGAGTVKTCCGNSP
jgi:hypothetical protein